MIRRVAKVSRAATIRRLAVVSLAVVASWPLLFACQSAPAPRPPPSDMATSGADAGTSASPTALGDSYQWLEEITDSKALAWVEARNAQTRAHFDSTADFAPLRQRLLEILDDQRRIPSVEKIGPHLYNFWRDQRHPRGLWRRTTIAEYKKDTPQWEEVLDLDALAKSENENWVWQGADCLRPAAKRCLLALSKGGGDAHVVREFDIERKAFVRDGFALPEAKSRVSWKDADTLFVATDFGPGTLTSSGYPRVVRVWRRGTNLSASTLLYEGQATDMVVSADRVRDYRSANGFDVVLRRPRFFEEEWYVAHGGTLTKLDLPLDASVSFWNDQVLIRLRNPWTIAGKTWADGALLAAPIATIRAGAPRFHQLYQPGDHGALVAITTTKHHVVVTSLEDVQTHVSVWTLAGNTWRDLGEHQVPVSSTVTISPYDPYTSDDLWVTRAGFLNPSTLELGAAAQFKTNVVKAMPALFRSEHLTVEQHFATSADGTRVPYFEISGKGSQPRPTILYGYGGFEIPLLPKYDPLVGAAWLETTGNYIVANIRGGGEYGPRWHQAALLHNRQRAYEDFQAVARDIVQRGVTTKSQLGIWGGSNGGLLTGVMLTQAPELFGAIVSLVPLLDMRRFHKLLAGASWMAEYGDPDNEADWTALEKFSPYQNARTAPRYPPAFFLTSTRDDRVHPGHARKMVARLSEYGQPVRYFENTEGGHAGAANNQQRALMMALSYTFMREELTRQ